MAVDVTVPRSGNVETEVVLVTTTSETIVLTSPAKNRYQTLSITFGNVHTGAIKVSLRLWHQLDTTLHKIFEQAPVPAPGGTDKPYLVYDYPIQLLDDDEIRVECDTANGVSVTLTYQSQRQ